MRIDRRRRLIEIEGGDGIGQGQVGLEIGLQRSHVFPVTLVHVRLNAQLGDGAGNDVAAEVHRGRYRQLALHGLSFEDVDAHRGEVARPQSRDLRHQRRQAILRRLLLELHDATGGVHLQDAEAGGLLGVHGNHPHRAVGLVVAVGGQHGAVIHLVELIARQDQNVARLVAPHVAQALADGVGCPLEPMIAVLGLLGGQDGYERLREDVELVGPADVLVQALRVELRQHEDAADVGVDAVRDGDVDQAVLAGDGDRRLRPLVRQGKQPGSPTPTQDDRQQVVFHHPRIFTRAGATGKNPPARLRPRLPMKQVLRRRHRRSKHREARLLPRRAGRVDGKRVGPREG